MPLDADELIIRQRIAEDLIAPVLPTGGRVIPAPIYFNDKEDYWATIESVSYTTKPGIESAHIMFCSLYLSSFSDIEGPTDSPLFGLVYELYLFSQYDNERQDETETPDEFDKKMLLRHNAFVACCLNLKEAFQGNRTIPGLDTSVYAIRRTTSLVQTERIQNFAQTEFIPGVRGHVARFQETVQLKLVAC